MNMRIKIALCFMLLSAFAKADVVYVNGNWDNIRAMAKSSNKYIFVDCYTDWCGWCKVMDKETMTDAGVSDMLNSKFVCAKIEMEHGEGVKLAMKYHVTGFPTFLFFNPQGELVYISMGYQKTEDFSKELKNALDKSKQFTAPGFSSSLDIDFPEFYKQSHAENGKRKFPETKEVVAFLDAQKNLFSETSWAVLAQFDAGDKYTKYFLDNIKQYEKLYGASCVEEKVNSVLYKQLSNAKKTKDKAALDELLRTTDKYVQKDAASMKVQFRMEFYKATGDWKSYAQALSDYIGLQGYSSADNINSICWNIYENCNDQGVLKTACGHMVKVVEAEPKYAYLDTYAALLFKSGQSKEAETWATKAISAGKTSGDDVSATEKLLEQIKSGKQK